MKLYQPLTNEKRSVFYTLVLGIWAMVAVYCVLHDQYIVRIAPQHFTEYHPHIFPIESPRLLAFAFAIGSSASPGLALGVLLFFIGRAGPHPKISLAKLFGGMLIVISVTELAAALSMLFVWREGVPLYPRMIYPEDTHAIYMTQTAQLTAYLMAFAASFTLLLYVHRQRRDVHRSTSTR